VPCCFTGIFYSFPVLRKKPKIGTGQLFLGHSGVRANMLLPGFFWELENRRCKLKLSWRSFWLPLAIMSSCSPGLMA